eukprot:1224180-Rhodomonas_salina.5
MAGTEYSVLKDKKYENYNTAHAPEGSEASAESITSHLPFYLKTDRQRWTAFCITTVMCALASGPVSAWPTLEPVLMKADLFKGMGQEQMFGAVYSFSIAAQLGVSLPAGNRSVILYTCAMPSADTASASGAASVGVLAASSAIAHTNDLQTIPLLAGQINTYGIFVFIWILPEHQNFVSSAAGAVTSLSGPSPPLPSPSYNLQCFSMPPSTRAIPSADLTSYPPACSATPVLPTPTEGPYPQVSCSITTILCLSPAHTRHSASTRRALTQFVFAFCPEPQTCWRSSPSRSPIAAVSSSALSSCSSPVCPSSQVPIGIKCSRRPRILGPDKMVSCSFWFIPDTSYTLLRYRKTLLSSYRN